MLAVGVILIVTSLVCESTAMRSTGPNDYNKCVPVEIVPLCSGLNYSMTTFPNLQGNRTPREAIAELNQFIPLMNTGCSSAPLKHPPCKRLCEYVENNCTSALERIGLHWPPVEHLACNNFNNDDLCFGPDDLSTLILPPIKTSQDTIRNFTAISTSPSTVKFSWDSNDNNFILQCDNSTAFPISTNETTVTVGHFLPDKTYTCRIFNSLTNSLVISFRTEKDGPPRNFAVVHKSPNSVILSWNHPDSEIPKDEVNNFIYLLSCINNQDHKDINHPTRGESETIEGLEPGTSYSCQVSLPRKDEATITFTTLENIVIQFVNNTPDIEANTVRIEFVTNRPVSTISCRILIPGVPKINCSNHTAIFKNISKGAYNLRIVAENNRKDRVVLRNKIYVSGSNNRSCAVNLINERIVQNGTSVMIYFKGTNSVNEFRCTLDNQNHNIPCYSPLLLLRDLNIGEHGIKITPTATKCNRSTNLPLVTAFIIT